LARNSTRSVPHTGDGTAIRRYSVPAPAAPASRASTSAPGMLPEMYATSASATWAAVKPSGALQGALYVSPAREDVDTQLGFAFGHPRMRCE